jgi:preprotein translocase subunit SecD
VTNEPVVNFHFSEKGASRFGKLTSDNVGKSIAIVLDRLVISAPRIMEPILGGNVQISGQFTTAEASNLVAVLRSGALPAPISFISMTTEPGADAAAKQQGL